MKKILLLTAVAAIMFISCKKDIRITEEPVIRNEEPAVTVEPEVKLESVNTEDQLLKKYEKEGFIDKSTFIVILIKPAGSKFNQLDIENQAKKRAFVSLQNYVMSENKRLSANDKTSIVNSINNNGKLKKINDEKQSRDVYVFEIIEENFYTKIKEMVI